jgi:DNA repair protein RadD
VNEGPSVRVCPKCFAAQFAGAQTCGYCGHQFEVKPRSLEQVDGDLVEIDPATLRRERQREQSNAKSFDELVALGKRRGYKNPYGWAKHLASARSKRGGD